VVDERTDLTSSANDDVIATDLRRRGEIIRGIVSVYDEGAGQSGERLAQKLNKQAVIGQCSTVLTGDFNAHISPRDPRF